MPFPDLGANVPTQSKAPGRPSMRWGDYSDDSDGKEGARLPRPVRKRTVPE